MVCTAPILGRISAASFVSAAARAAEPANTVISIACVSAFAGFHKSFYRTDPLPGVLLFEL